MAPPKSRPLDTVGGIMDAINAVRTKQCPATFANTRGTIVFCEYNEGHDGEHKGFRKRWPNRASESNGTSPTDATDK